MSAGQGSIHLNVTQAHELVKDTLIRCHTSVENASSVAKALIAAEEAGQIGHGLRRLPSYAGQSKSGKVDGFATPVSKQTAKAALHIDAKSGFAYPALEMAIDGLAALTPQTGIAAAAINHSHHAGVTGVWVELLAQQGLVAMMFANSPSAIAPWGGNKGLFGTNPIAFAAPVHNDNPIVIDLSMSKVARGKIMAASQKGDDIPEGWAFDAEGRSTTKADDALKGTMAPLGDAKGAALALMVELLAAGITGANFASDASSYFAHEGTPPGTGQFMIAMAPTAFGSQNAVNRISALAQQINDMDGTRLPGARRQNIKQDVQQNGIIIDQALMDEISAV